MSSSLPVLLQSWNIQTGTDSRLRKYRLQDNYLRFYLKYIEKNLGKINRDTYSMRSPGEWHTIIGLQFENLVLSNRKSIHNILRIDERKSIFSEKDK